MATAEPRIAELEALAEQKGFDPTSYLGNWRNVGSLGSGNHFIEVSVDEADTVWLFRTRSRGVGNRIAQHHIKVAQRLATQWWIDLPHRDLAYLVEGTSEFTRYIAELTWAYRAAQPGGDDGPGHPPGRRVGRDAGRRGGADQLPPQLHRARAALRQGRVGVPKGAIKADPGRPGLIPGSMGTASYVVEGSGTRCR